MVRGFTRTASLLAALILLAAGGAMADTLSLADGSTVTGSFIYDATTNSVVSFDFTTSGTATFGGESFVGPVSQSSSAIVLNNLDGDQVFAFDSVQSSGFVDELDIVVSCGGVANCVNQATVGNSFAITAGQPTCGTTGFCIASGIQNNVPESLSQDLMTGNNFITITDPVCPSTDHCYTLTLSTTSTGTVFSGNNNGGGGNTGVPEPSTLVLSALGFAALALKRAYS